MSTSQRLISAAELSQTRLARYNSRKRVNQIALTLSLAAMLFGVFWLVWILWETIRLGLGGLSVALFTQMTPPPNEVGGISNAIFGSVVMVLLATFVGTPIGIMAGIYLAEYESRSWLAATTRFVNDILLSAPSIVIGLFVYAVVVARFKSFRLRRRSRLGADRDSGGHPHHREHAVAGACQPARSGLRPGHTQVARYHHGHFACRTRWRDHRGVAGCGTYCGETAPLLFTALNNQFWNADLSKPMASLPVTIFKFAMSPYENWQELAWAGVFLITVAVLGLNILARVLTRQK